ncbi:NADH-quinone oxidoreductase subunit J [Desulfohalotomaculum tongense]|uniref:NADH-quinone oxidoreductase subunit J family protein n=1 Tax=Desulforadius tongensis TaxID=1216062 RepID=UPI00195D588E|nr:NADH-quinone oxidoreductase subunit J [Desulforadius tongensis]MBM7854360.1 NADH-quinone oxidoreductase subunit J [Desulforadius tongensis]
MELTLEAAAFWTLAAVIIVSALLVVTGKNIVHSILWLVVTFLGIAGVFIMLDAMFLAAVQVLVYAGAVCIMVVFGVMLTQRGSMEKSSLFNKRVIIAAPLAGLILAVAGFLAAVSKESVPLSGGTVPADTVSSIGEWMLTRYVVPFEAAAILLLVALIGAVFLAGEVNTDADGR